MQFLTLSLRAETSETMVVEVIEVETIDAVVTIETEAHVIRRAAREGDKVRTIDSP